MSVVWSGKVDAAFAGKVLDGYQKKYFALVENHTGVVNVGTLKSKVRDVEEGVALPAVDDVSAGPLAGGANSFFHFLLSELLRGSIE